MGDVREQIAGHMATFILSRRRDLGLSLQDVADRAGCTKSHIWELEKGYSKNPTLAMLLGLTDALQCSLNSLIGRDVAQPIITDDEMALIAAHRRIFEGDR